MYKQGLYHDWVPKPVQLLLIILCTLPLLMASGIYTSNISTMVGDLGAKSEDFLFANYAGFIGMTAGMLLVLRTKQYFRTKELAIGSFLAISFFTWLCYISDNPELIVFSSFFIGFFRMIGLIEFILPIYFIISPTFDRLRFYPIFYPMAIVSGIGGGHLYSTLAYNFGWERVYLIALCYLLSCALLSVVFMHNSRSQRKVPLYQFSWLSLIMYSSMFMILNYILVYMKYHAWYQSTLLRWLSVSFVILTLLFGIIQQRLKRPLISLTSFKRKSVYSSLIMFLFMGLFQASGSLQSALTSSVLNYDSPTSSFLNLAMIPGIILGGIFCFYWFKLNLKIKWLIVSGFSAYVVAHILLYFIIAPVIDMEYFFIPTLLRGMGMCILYISITSHCSQGLSVADSLSVFSILLVIRSFLGIALFSTVLSWAMYKLQLQNVFDLAAGIDSTDYLQLQRGGPMSIYGSVQYQALLITIKKLFGYTIIAGFIVILYVVSIRFEPIHHRRLIYISKKLSGSDTKGYHFKPRNLERVMEEGVQAAV